MGSRVGRSQGDAAASAPTATRGSECGNPDAASGIIMDLEAHFLPYPKAMSASQSLLISLNASTMEITSEPFQKALDRTGAGGETLARIGSQ